MVVCQADGKWNYSSQSCNIKGIVSEESEIYLWFFFEKFRLLLLLFYKSFCIKYNANYFDDTLGHLWQMSIIK